MGVVTSCFVYHDILVLHSLEKEEKTRNSRSLIFSPMCMEFYLSLHKPSN